jgi:hypothetical protein
VSVDATAARFPDVGRRAGFYESFYLRACDPSERRGIWIRHTVHKKPGVEPQASLWFVLFDPAAGAPYAVKQTHPAPELSSGNGDWIRIGDSRLTASSAAGSASGEGRTASWDLTLEAGETPLFHLPRDWMYTAPVPRTKTLSPAPAARFGGSVTAGDRTVDLSGWVGMVGHNWGAQHAERWIWMHGLAFDGVAADGTWIDAAIGRIKLGPWTTPWIGNGELCLGGKRYRLGGLERTRATRVEETPSRAMFVLPGPEVTVRGEVGADKADFVGWIYSDPDGGRHDAVNCSAAGMTLKVERDGEDPVTLTTDGGATYELGMREQDHGIQVQPFPDP